MYHFTDDTNLLNFNSCVKSINKQVNYDLKNFSYLLKVIKIFVYVGKIDCDMKIKLNVKGFMKQIQSGIQIDKRLTWKQQINHVALKVNKANAMLSKLRHVLDIKTQRSVYYAIFESNVCYISLVLAQNTIPVKRLHLLQKKFLRIMLLQSRNSHTGPLFKVSKVLKSFDKMAFENCIFISKSLKGLLPSTCNNWFKKIFESHS